MSEMPFKPWIQKFCPGPRRFLQALILQDHLRTGLDIGCGESSALSGLRTLGFRSTGLDVSPTRLEVSRQRDLHDEYILGDIRELTFEHRFDVVVLSSVIEHLSREDGMDLLRRVESLASRIVYVETPNGFREQADLDGDPAQRHFSGWYSHDFEGRGYTVLGSGIQGLRGVAGRARILPESIVRLFERSLQWFVFRRPRRAGTLAAILCRDERGNLRTV
jgi:hypothetical protein